VLVFKLLSLFIKQLLERTAFLMKMKNIITLGFLLVICAALTFNFIQSTTTIRVAVAANLSYPMQKIKERFQKDHPHVNVEVISASSGKLTAQISHQAPFHIFISANMQYPNNLFEKGITTQKPTVITHGRAIGWSKKKLSSNLLSTKNLIALLQSDVVKNIAIAEPDLAPYGKAAQDWLKSQGIWEKLKNKLVYGENVGKVNQYVYAESVDFAFTAASASYFKNMSEKGSWIPLKQQKGIPHGGMVLNFGLENEKEASKLFFDYLLTAEAQEILDNFGYGEATH